MTENWLSLAQDVVYAETKTPAEAYDWLLFCISSDIKEALDFVPMEQLVHDLETRGIYLGLDHDYS